MIYLETLNSTSGIIDYKQYRQINEKNRFTEKCKGKVIPYTIEPISGKCYFLLGKEIWCNYKQRQYNMIGGLELPSDSSIIECAARELSEETMNVFDKDECILALKGIPRENIIYFTKQSHNQRIHIYTFFMPIPYQDSKSIVNEFKTRRVILDDALQKPGPLDYITKKIINQTLQLGYDDPYYISKSFIKPYNELYDISWISEDFLFDETLTNPFLMKRLLIPKDRHSKCYYSFTKMQQKNSTTRVYSDILKKSFHSLVEVSQ